MNLNNNTLESNEIKIPKKEAENLKKKIILKKLQFLKKEAESQQGKLLNLHQVNMINQMMKIV